MPSPVPSSLRAAHNGLLLGVDGGGSKTVAWLAKGDKYASLVTIGVGLAGAGNPQAVGIETAQRNIVAAVEQAFAAAGLAPRPVAAACLALAGVGRQSMSQQMLQWARDAGLAHRVRVVHDAQAVLAAGTRGGMGVAVICGTGSFAYGEDGGGRCARSGGWGYLLGDEGSGYAIGHAALRAVARAADGRGPATQLTATILNQLQLNEPMQLIQAVYDAASVRHAVATLAPYVFDAARDGDAVAEQIVHDAADELAQLVRSVATQLELSAGQFDLALSGGAIIHQHALAQGTAQWLATHHCTPRSTRLVPDPVAGAVLLAAQSRAT